MKYRLNDVINWMVAGVHLCDHGTRITPGVTTLVDFFNPSQRRLILIGVRLCTNVLPYGKIILTYIYAIWLPQLGMWLDSQCFTANTWQPKPSLSMLRSIFFIGWVSPLKSYFTYQLRPDWNQNCWHFEFTYPFLSNGFSWEHFFFYLDGNSRI